MSYIGRVEQKASDIRRFNVTGSTSATHTLTWTAPSEQSLIVTINGVKQQEDAYSVSGVTLTLTSALVSTDKMEVVGILDIGESTIPPDDSIGTAKIQDDAVTADKLASGLANATHTGDVTGATALTIANDAVDIAMLSATGTASSSTFLRGDNAWAEAGGGKVLQVVTTKSQALVSSTSEISFETATPYANTQGVEMLTATITPNATANRLVVVCSFVGTTENGSVPTIALWQDSDTNAIAAANSCTNGTDSGGHIGLIWEQAAGTTSATTFKIRGGPHSATTFYMNGRNAGVKWGGVPISTLQIWEIEA